VSPRSLASLLALLLPFTAGAAGAQELRDLVFEWAQGDYRAPLTCTIDGVPRQALRRITIEPLPQRTARPGVRVTFFDLEVAPGTRCISISGEAEPNVAGHVDLVFEGRSRPDTGLVDFRNALRRDAGFDFAIDRGRLRIAPSEGGTEPRLVDFGGGGARLEAAGPGSDAGRQLASFRGSRNRVLQVSARAEPPLVFPLTELSR